MLDGLLPLVLLPFSVDLFGLFWSGLLHFPLPLSEASLDASLPLQLAFLLNVHTLSREASVQVVVRWRNDVKKECAQKPQDTHTANYQQPGMNIALLAFKVIQL